MDFISSILGILISSIHKFFYRKNFLYSRLKPKRHIVQWFLLIILRKNFKKYVQDLGLNPWKYPDVNDLRKARLSTKDDIEKYFSRDSMSRLLKLFSLKMSSSGSTGKPFEFNIFILQWIEEQARVYSSFMLGGYRIGKKMVIFRSYSPTKKEKNIKEIRWKRWTYFNSFSLDEDSLREYYDYLVENNIKFIRTYPSTLATFLEFLKSKNLKIKLNMIHVSSENISDVLIEKAEEYFNCRVINYYGQAEQAVLGVNISESLSISILPYTNWYRLEDNTLATFNILNWSNPLVNYHVEDHLVMTKDNHFNIVGRNNIYLTHSSGYKVSTINFYTLMQKYTNITKWQIIQENDHNIKIHFEGNMTQIHQDEIELGIKERLGNVSIKFVTNSFQFNGEGKINPIVANN